MIKLYPTKIEAYDENKDLMFVMEAIDNDAAKIDFKGAIKPNNIDELVEAMRRAVQMLELE